MAGQLENYLDSIKRAANHDPVHELVLREVLRSVADECPLDSLLKISQFIADEIYPDAEKHEASRN